MFRSQFSQKKSTPVKTGTFRRGAVASAPMTRGTAMRVEKIAGKPRMHTRTINTLCIRSINYKEEIVMDPETHEPTTEKVIHVYFYDNIEGMTLDYVSATSEEDANTYEEFKGCSLLPLWSTEKNPSKANIHLDAIQDMFDDMAIAGGFEVATKKEGEQKLKETKAYKVVFHSETRTCFKQQLSSNNDFEVNCNLIYPSINDPSNTTQNKNRTVWIGFFRKGTADSAYFIKGEISKYIIDNLYVGYGSVENGEFTPATKPVGTSEIEVKISAEKFAVPSGSQETEDAIITKITSTYLTNCIEKENFNDISTVYLRNEIVSFSSLVTISYPGIELTKRV